jgi:hypothetical protein
VVHLARTVDGVAVPEVPVHAVASGVLQPRDGQDLVVAPPVTLWLRTPSFLRAGAARRLQPARRRGAVCRAAA